MIQKLPVATIWQLFGEDVLTHDIISAAWMQAWIKWDRCVLCIVPYSIYKIWIHWEQRRFYILLRFFGSCLTSHVSYHKHNMSFQLVSFTYPNSPYAVVTAVYFYFSLFSLVIPHFLFSSTFFFFLYFKLNACLVLSNLYCIPFGWMRTIRHIHAQP